MPRRPAEAGRVTVLELQDVDVVFERKGRVPVRAVSGASLDLGSGEIVGLVGESGCGKSTLARVAVGLERPASGTVTFDGRPLLPLGRRSRPAADAKAQLVFQNPFSSLNPRRKVGALLADALAILELVPREKRASRVSELLELVGLPGSAADRYPHQFSGGQRQRIAIARALAAEPKVVILDEPLSSLDASAQAQVANLLVSLSRELGLGLLLISHDLAIVRHIADRTFVMYLGQIVESGPTAELWSTPLHPYTEALIASIPDVDAASIPEALEGDVPDPAHPPPGCRFHPRCAYAFDSCRVEEPLLRSLHGERQVSCWLQEPGRGSLMSPRELAESAGGRRSARGTGP